MQQSLSNQDDNETVDIEVWLFFLNSFLTEYIFMLEYLIT